MERLCGSRRFCYACLSLAPDLSPPSITIEEIIVVLTLVFRFVAVVSLAFCSWPALAQQFSADMVRLQGFLSRNGLPHHILDPAIDREA